MKEVMCKLFGHKWILTYRGGRTEFWNPTLAVTGVVPHRCFRYMAPEAKSERLRRLHAYERMTVGLGRAIPVSNLIGNG